MLIAISRVRVPIAGRRRERRPWVGPVGDELVEEVVEAVLGHEEGEGVVDEADDDDVVCTAAAAPEEGPEGGGVAGGTGFEGKLGRR